MDYTAIIVAILGSSTLGGLIGAWFTRRKVSAEADRTLGQVWLDIVERLEADIAGMKHEVAALRLELEQVKSERTDLRLQVASLTNQLDSERRKVETLTTRVRELEQKNGT